MKPKSLLFLVIVFVALASTLFILKNKRKSSFSNKKSMLGKKALPNLPINEVASIKISTQKESVEISRVKETWVVKNKGNYPASFDKISQSLLSLKDVKILQNSPKNNMLENSLNLTPDSDENASIQLNDKDGKQLAKIVMGKMHFDESSKPSPYNPKVANGRYIITSSYPESIITVQETLEDFDQDPVAWLNENFFKIEKIKSIKVAFTDKKDSWKISRSKEDAEFKLSKKEGEKDLDPSINTRAKNILSYGEFEDVVLPLDKKKKKEILAGAIKVSIQTFDNFKYQFLVKEKDNKDKQDHYYFSLVKYNSPKIQNKEKAKKKNKESEENTEEDFKIRIKSEKSLVDNVYIVSNFYVDIFLKKRSEIFETDEPKEKNVPREINLPPTMAPPINVN